MNVFILSFRRACLSSARRGWCLKYGQGLAPELLGKCSSPTALAYIQQSTAAFISLKRELRGTPSVNVWQASEKYAKKDDRNQNLCGSCWKCININLTFGSCSLFSVLKSVEILALSRWTHWLWVATNKFPIGCTHSFLSAFLNFHLFFFHLHPGIEPVLWGWIHLNVITSNGKRQAHLCARSHNVTFQMGGS